MGLSVGNGRGRHLRMAWKVLIVAGTNTGDSTKRNVRMYGRYDIVIGTSSPPGNFGET
jgi:hypothetical protein